MLHRIAAGDELLFCDKWSTEQRDAMKKHAVATDNPWEEQSEESKCEESKCEHCQSIVQHVESAQSVHRRFLLAAVLSLSPAPPATRVLTLAVSPAPAALHASSCPLRSGFERVTGLVLSVLTIGSVGRLLRPVSVRDDGRQRSTPTSTTATWYNTMKHHKPAAISHQQARPLGAARCRSLCRCSPPRRLRVQLQRHGTAG